MARNLALGDRLLEEACRIGRQPTKKAVVTEALQELLSVVRVPAQFRTLRTRLRTFPDLPLDTGDYELAAEYGNLCRSKGVQGSSVDFLLCAVAVRHRLAILTVDRAFAGYLHYLPIRLHEPRQF